VLAVIIPPSILMIVWGGTLSVSIGALFLAGILPGLLLGFVQMATVHVYAKLRNYPKYPRSTLQEVVAALIVDPGADDAGDHHRRQDLRLVHRHRIGGDRGDLRRGALDLRLPRAEAARASTRR
jgi:TRAP-type mannitol/chloroaromatic compound transport system permease large subunit